jgi:hypothetical protein
MYRKGLNRKPSNILEKFTPSLEGFYRVTTYHFHEIARVLPNPSRHYGRVQWVFSPPVHCLATIMTRAKPIPLNLHLLFCAAGSIEE